VGLTSPRFRDGWVFSAREDLLWFGGPVVVAALVAWIAWRTGTLAADVPAWAFLVVVVGCDVAHVWATAFRAYLDPTVVRRRGGLLLGVPLACFAVGVVLHAQGAMVFWRALAYVAAFHFVRQPWGWMSYAARRAGETSRVERRLDFAAIHAVSLYPLLWWHAHLPRAFVWFRDDDFAPGLPVAVVDVAAWLCGAILAAWVGAQVVHLVRREPVNRAKALVLASTAAIWFGGIVVLDSDLVFTTSNVLAHGLPYLALVHRYGAARWRGTPTRLGRLFAPGLPVLAYGAAVVGAAYLEESLWDAAVWHQHGGWFPWPDLAPSEAVLALVVPLLALPQATHYVLDAFVWRPSADPGLTATLALGVREQVVREAASTPPSGGKRS
jgi:hypothetical protein